MCDGSADADRLITDLCVRGVLGATDRGIV